MKPVRIHITGCAPRSGTTLMMELFRQCFEIEAFGRHEISVFEKPRPEPPLYCSKRPQDILIVEPLLRHDESLWVVFLLRDPRDVIVSEHRLRPGSYWCHLGVWKQRYRIARALWDHPRFCVVRYEDLALRPDEVQRQLEARMPFLRRTRLFSEWGSERVSEASEKALGGVRPISAESIGGWRERRGRILSQMQKHGPIARELVELGYEPDDAWLRTLEGVAPDPGASVYVESGLFEGGVAERLAALGRSLRFHFWRISGTARYRMGLSRRVDLEGS
jgi:hypothetical protein